MNANSTEQRTPPSRRDAIKRALAAGGVAYVAPMILGSASPASAQAISGTTCVGCAGLSPFQTCAPNCNCYGRAQAPFGYACVGSNPVDNICSSTPTTCDLDSQCGPGELCIVACGTGQLAGKCHACCDIDLQPV